MKNTAPNHIGHSSPRLSVIIPVLNEEEAIVEVIEGVIRFSPPGTEILVIDNNSIDRTIRYARRKGVRIEKQIRQGKGNAMCLGAIKARGDIIIFIDGDGTYPSEVIGTLIEPITRDNRDVVYASRFIQGGRNGMSFRRYWGNRILSQIASVFYSPTTDLLTGLFAIRKEAFLEMNLTSGGFEIETEIFIKSCQKNYRREEVPIHFYQRKGESKIHLLQDGGKISWMLLRSKCFL